ncbi:hydroxyisourate hydrolase [Streptosporangium sandarakinum]|uniref:hydroxyisourate hydrolase n=1 Tax=Streptosporangium sandarakinum TaxID=1260955 RepID=UPI00378AEDD4
MSLSTHVLDASLGRPATGVAVRLEHGGEVLAEGVTGADGRIGGWATIDTGAHRLVFATGEYFAAQGIVTFYPEVTVDFTVADPAEHHHVPLLLSPFAYSTYRGS